MVRRTSGHEDHPEESSAGEHHFIAGFCSQHDARAVQQPERPLSPTTAPGVHVAASRVMVDDVKAIRDSLVPPVRRWSKT